MLEIQRQSGRVYYKYTQWTSRIIFLLFGVGLIILSVYLSLYSNEGTGSYIPGGMGVLFLIMSVYFIYYELNPITLDLMKKRLIKGKYEVSWMQIKNITIITSSGGKNGTQYTLCLLLKDGTSKNISLSDTDYNGKKEIAQSIAKELGIEFIAPETAMNKVMETLKEKFAKDIKGDPVEISNSLSYSITAIILAAVGIFIPGFGIIFSILALIFAVISHRKFKTTFSKTALIISIVSFVINLVLVLGVLTLIEVMN